MDLDCLDNESTGEMVVDKDVFGAMTLEDKLMRAKVTAVDKAYRLMVDDHFDDIKEFKDLVSIIDIVDRSERKKTEPTDSIGGIVEDIMSNFKDDV